MSDNHKETYDLGCLLGSPADEVRARLQQDSPVEYDMISGLMTFVNNSLGYGPLGEPPKSIHCIYTLRPGAIAHLVSEAVAVALAKTAMPGVICWGRTWTKYVGIDDGMGNILIKVGASVIEEPGQ